MDYLDFELLIDRREGRTYRVDVIESPVGDFDYSEDMYLPFSDDELAVFMSDLPDILLRSSNAAPDEPLSEEYRVREFGRKLFNALFVGDLRALYRQSQQKVMQQGAALRLILRIRPPELSVLPWEYLYDERESDYVCLAQQTSIVRYVETPNPRETLKIEPPLRILAMVASPLTMFQFDATEEQRRLSMALQDLERSELIQVEWLQGQTWSYLHEAMQDDKWHAFYFVGHGAFHAEVNEGCIFLEDEKRLPYRLSAAKLGRLLQGTKMRFVMLNACDSARGSFSSTAVTLVRRGIPAVLAMQSWLSEPAATRFSHEFFKTLAYAVPVDTALIEARKVVSLALGNTLEWGTPALYMHARDGVLFTRERAIDDERSPVSSNSPDVIFNIGQLNVKGDFVENKLEVHSAGSQENKVTTTPEPKTVQYPAQEQSNTNRLTDSNAFVKQDALGPQSNENTITSSTSAQSFSCPECGTRSDAEARFCAECGASLRPM